MKGSARSMMTWRPVRSTGSGDSDERDIKVESEEESKELAQVDTEEMRCLPSSVPIQSACLESLKSLFKRSVRPAETDKTRFQTPL